MHVISFFIISSFLLSLLLLFVFILLLSFSLIILNLLLFFSISSFILLISIFIFFSWLIILFISKIKENKLKNEIICIYNKQEDEINLLHDYNKDIKDWSEEDKKPYIEGKNNISENNIDIYINDKNIKFNYKYKSNEKGNIKVKFIFNKLLASTCCMFRGCSSLQSIGLSSFNATNVEDMTYMFEGCSSLQSIDLSSINTINIKDISWMFEGC